MPMTPVALLEKTGLYPLEAAQVLGSTVAVLCSEYRRVTGKLHDNADFKTVRQITSSIASYIGAKYGLTEALSWNEFIASGASFDAMHSHLEQMARYSEGEYDKANGQSTIVKGGKIVMHIKADSEKEAKFMAQRICLTLNA